MLDFDIKEFGELDSYSQIQFIQDDCVITTAQLSLVQSGFSKRAWTELPVDTYKGNGRVRHEYVNIHVGPLFNIQIHSYQEAENHEANSNKTSIGGKHHFDIYIFRNTKIIGGKPFEHIEFGKLHNEKYKSSNGYLGHNEHARRQVIDELLNDLPSDSELNSHIIPSKILSALCYNQSKQIQGKIPYTVISKECKLSEAILL